jgi:hypothetical protein
MPSELGGSSRAMEMDMYVKLVQQVNEKEGCKVVKIVADGDSCSIARVRAEVDETIEKIEDSNHLLQEIGSERVIQLTEDAQTCNSDSEIFYLQFFSAMLAKKKTPTTRQESKKGESLCYSSQI